MEMKADRNYKKGEVIATFEPNFFISNISLPRQSDRDYDHTCRVCGCPMMIPISHGSVSMKSLPGFDDGRKRFRVLSEEFIDNWGWNCCSSTCLKKSNKLYSSVCPIEGQDEGKGQGASEEMRKFFRRIPTNIDDISLLVAVMIQDDGSILDGMKTCLQCHDDISLEDEPPDRVTECWTILKSDLYNRGVTEVISADTFYKLYQSLRQRNVHQISVDHPIVEYTSKTLLTLSDDGLDTALAIMDKMIPGLIQCGEKDNRPTDHEGHCLQDMNDNIRRKVFRWRKAVRLVQAVSSNIVDDKELSSFFGKQATKAISQLRESCFAFCPDINLEHSCVPNCIVESSPFGGDNLKVEISLVALHDIDEGESMTLSRIHNLPEDIESRQTQLRSMFGPKYQCDCSRCRCEREWDKKNSFCLLHDTACRDIQQRDLTFHVRDMRQIADLAMQHADYRLAYDLYSLILNVNPSDGDVLHARCASILERGNFEKAQQMWNEAYNICPSHKGIALQIKKQEAYAQKLRSLDSDSRLSKPSSMKMSNDGSFITLIPGKCFTTTPEHPLLSSEECSQAIEWAEEAAESRSDGWTTSRHYAVPTTDIPIHEIPKLLHWFNDILKFRLRPLLAKQFGEDEVGRNGSGVFIHDAFIVRYDATGGQKHLPLHRDQSSHSFTIALNALADYDGGGTYVSEINRSIRPSIGGAVSFRGDQLLHGGDPVVRGVRYIIVAFCYVCKSDDNRKAKKIKLDGIFKKDDEQAKGNFSFGFNF